MRLLPFFAEIAPLICLFIGTELYNIFVGASASVVVAIMVMVIIYFTERNIAKFALFSVALSAIFTLGALITEASVFIKIQPTLFNLSFGVVLLTGRLYGKPMMKQFFGTQFFLTDAAWLTLTMRWGIFMFVLGGANEWAWRTLSDEGWVTFKLFIIAPATTLFMAAQIPITLRSRIPQTKAETR